MAERVESPMLQSGRSLGHILTSTRVASNCQGRQWLAAILPESFDVAVYRECRPNLMMHEGLLELLGASRAELCAFLQATGL